MASPTLGHRFDSELNRLEAEAARRKERAPSVLVGSPLSADEVRTELPVVQATFLTRQMSQSPNVAERETKTERERSMAEKGKEEAVLVFSLSASCCNEQIFSFFFFREEEEKNFKPTTSSIFSYFSRQKNYSRRTRFFCLQNQSSIIIFFFRI